MSEENGLQKFSKKYGDITALRALMQAIPYVGGSLDTLLSDSGQKIKWRRVEDFLQKLNERISRLEKEPEITNLAENENAYDLLSYGLEQAVKTRHEEKRQYFAAVISNQIGKNKDWGEAETALRLVAELSELHVHILKAAINTPECGKPFAGLKVICTNSKDAERHSKEVPPNDISKMFTDVSESILKLHISELIAKGLLKDEGIGRYDTAGMIYFIPTEMASWLLRWISESQS